LDENESNADGKRRQQKQKRRRSMLRKTAKKTAVLLVSLLLISASATFSAPQKVKLTFWDENAGPNRTPYLQELLKRFNKANPSIEVEYVGLPWSSSKQKIDVAIAANSTPDVSGVSTNWVAEFALNGAILPLDPYFNKAPDKKQFAPVHIQAIRDLVPNKKLYELPNTFNANLFWYRPDWFKEAGLNPPATWEEFFDIIAKMTDKSKNRYGYSIRGGSGSVNNLEMLLYAYSGLTEYFDKKGKCTINHPLHVEFLKKYVAIYGKYTPESDITNGYKEMVANFDNGIAAMIMHNIGSYGEHMQTLGPGKFAAAAFPVGKLGKRTAITALKGYVIYKGTKYPAESWKLVHFLASAESQSYWNQKIGQLPTRLDVMNEPWVSEAQHLKLMGDTFADKKSVALKNPQYLPDYNAILTRLDPAFQEVLLGKRPVEKFLNDWASAMEKAKAEYDKVFNKK